MASVLLVNPSYVGTYGAAKGSITDPVYPTLGLATIAGAALEHGHRLEILDLSYRTYDWRIVSNAIRTIKPDVVGITATTPMMNQLRDISVLCKSISEDIVVTGGGAHVSALPIESMNESMLDLAVVGEGDQTFVEICNGHDPRTISGLYFRDGAGAVRFSGPRSPVENLDDMAMPAWHLYEPSVYKRRISRLLAKRRPCTIAEFSRGCVFDCDFCASKMTMAMGYRRKSPERCVEEVKLLRKLGWREFMLADDIFTSDRDWATRVSKAIARSDLDMTWSCNNGIRVESASDELFQAMRKAGCYRISFGLESGNDRVLRTFGKGGRASLERGRIAVGRARAAGLEVNGFFLLGLSSDTEETMQDTIEYARSLPLDTAKFGITTAFPGSRMFDEYAREALILSFDWNSYHVHTTSRLFQHRTLAHETVQRYLRDAYRKSYLLNTGFLLRRLKRGVSTGELFSDLYHFLRFCAVPAANSKLPRHNYFGEERWPTHDFFANPPQFYGFQEVRPSQTKPRRKLHTADSATPLRV